MMSREIPEATVLHAEPAGMTSNRLLITAMVVENRPVREVAATYGVSTSWLYELLARYRREGDAVFEPRSRRPASNPNATPLEVVDLIVRLRKELADQGLDAGPADPRQESGHALESSLGAHVGHVMAPTGVPLASCATIRGPSMRELSYTVAESPGPSP